MKWGLLVVLALFLSFSGAAGEDDDYYYDYEYDYEEIRFIEAPWEYLNRRDRIIKKKAIGPAGWICSRYNLDEPWLAYDALEDYLRGNNEFEKKFQSVTWPMVRSIPQDEGIEAHLCHYLEKESHCDIPMPMSRELYSRPKEPRVIYWSNEFWGQASDRRVTYVINVQLMRSFKRKDLLDKVDLAVAYLAYWPDNKKEVSFNLLDQTDGASFYI